MSPQPHWAGRIQQPPTGEGGGASTLTELTDVTGEPGFGKSPVDDGTAIFPLTRVATADDITGILTTVSTPVWHVIGDPAEPPYQAGFRPTGDPWAGARYRLAANNVVHLEGQVTNDDQTSGPATWLPIFQFPQDCLPGVSLRFACLARDDSIGKIIVWNDGLVLWGGYVTGPGDPGIPYVSLDGISFSVGGTSPVITAALEARFAA